MAADPEFWASTLRRRAAHAIRHETLSMFSDCLVLGLAVARRAGHVPLDYVDRNLAKRPGGALTSSDCRHAAKYFPTALSSSVRCSCRHLAGCCRGGRTSSSGSSLRWFRIENSELANDHRQDACTTTSRSTAGTTAAWRGRRCSRSPMPRFGQCRSVRGARRLQADSHQLASGTERGVCRSPLSPGIAAQKCQRLAHRALST